MFVAADVVAVVVVTFDDAVSTDVEETMDTLAARLLVACFEDEMVVFAFDLSNKVASFDGGSGASESEGDDTER